MPASIKERARARERHGELPEERHTMIEEFRDCPVCGQGRAFAQHHPQPGQCPDAADGWCPEWFCLTCGTGVFLGLVPGAAGVTPGAGRLVRVA